MPSIFEDVVNEAKRTPGNVSKALGAVEKVIPGASTALGFLLGGPLGAVVGAGLRHPPIGKGKRGPRPVGVRTDSEMPDLCRVAKANGAVITDEAETIYDYKTIAAGALSNTDFFDDTTTTNITTAKKIPAGVYKEVAVTMHLANASDDLSMIMDAIVRMKSGKNGDIVWERRLGDLSDFFLVDTTHGTFLRQEPGMAEDADIVVVDENALNYFNILWPSGQTTTGNLRVNLMLRKYPLPG
jgi:hypothetical protein